MVRLSDLRLKHVRAERLYLFLNSCPYRRRFHRAIVSAGMPRAISRHREPIPSRKRACCSMCHKEMAKKNCLTVRFCRKDASIHIGILSLFLCIYKNEIVATLKRIKRILDFVGIRLVKLAQIYRFALAQPAGGSSEARRSLRFLFKGLAGRRPSPYERSKMAIDRCSHDKGPRPGLLRRRTVS